LKLRKKFKLKFQGDCKSKIKSKIRIKIEQKVNFVKKKLFKTNFICVVREVIILKYLKIVIERGKIAIERELHRAGYDHDHIIESKQITHLWPVANLP